MNGRRTFEMSRMAAGIVKAGRQSSRQRPTQTMQHLLQEEALHHMEYLLIRFGMVKVSNSFRYWAAGNTLFKATTRKGISSSAIVGDHHLIGVIGAEKCEFSLAATRKS